jgi:hypothetical protein
MDQTPATNRFVAGIRWLALAMLLILALGLLICLLSEASSRIQRRIDAIKKAGYPVTVEDLEKIYPPLPDDQNSAIIYEKAFSQLSPLPTNMDGWPRLLRALPPLHVHATNLPPEVAQRISMFVDQNQSTFSLLHQAAAIKDGRYDVVFWKSDLRNFLPMLGACNRLGWAIALHVEESNVEATVESILDSFGQSRSLKDCPLVSAQMVREDCLGLSCSAIELALNRTMLSDPELKRLSAATHEAESVDGIKFALLSDRCSEIAYHDEMNVKVKLIPSQNIPFSRKLRIMIYEIFHHRDTDYISYLDSMSEYIAASDLPYPQRVEIIKRIYFNELRKPTNNQLDIEVWHDRLMIDAGVHTDLLLSETALAIERYRLANKDHLPATLQELVPAYLDAVPADPFDGRPIRYNRLPKGYLIYSVGEDGVDNGGAEWNEETKTGDITFTVER